MKLLKNSFSEVDFLISKLSLKFIKIASGECNNYPLIEYIAKKKVFLNSPYGNKSKIEIEKAIRDIKN